jgi:hypothetical protein
MSNELELYMLKEYSFKHLALAHHSFTSTCNKIMHIIHLLEVWDKVLDNLGGTEVVYLDRAHHISA